MAGQKTLKIVRRIWGKEIATYLLSRGNSFRKARQLAVALLIFPFASIAHHSHGEFSGETIEIKGEIVTIVWRNPHPALTLRVTDSQGEEDLWRVQVLGNVNGLNRNGVNGDRFQVGKNVTLIGPLSSYRDGLILAEQARFPEGDAIALGPSGSLGEVAYGNDRSNIETKLSSQSIFRVWTVVNRTRNFELPLRDHAVLAKQTWNPVLDDQQRNCTPMGMPGAMMSPHPIEFQQKGNDIILKLEEWDGVRNIKMNEDSLSSLSNTSTMGNSTGRWEERTLVVNTKAINYPYLDEFGTPQSGVVEVLERFILSEDGRTLDWNAVVTDPETFNEPFTMATAQWQWLPGATLQPYDCSETDDLLDP